VYSIAISLLEFLGESREKMSIQIFGSDLSATAIGKARLGIYNQSAVRNLSRERLERFFTGTDGSSYRINKMVRDNCVFVRHDVTRDPPFSKLDLISCRNVLIYFGPALQKRVLPIFHFSLKLPGFLLLGHNETTVGFDRLFTPIDKTQRIFSRTSIASRLVFATPAGNYGLQPPTRDGSPRGGARSQLNVQRQADQLLLARHAPPGVLVNEAMEIVQFRGRTGAYLEPAPGEPRANLLRMAREGLSPQLRLAFERAKKEGAIVRREGVQFRREDQTKTANIEVVPVPGIPDSPDRHFLVLFEDASERSSKRSSQSKSRARSERWKQKRGAHPTDRQLLQLNEELAVTKKYVQSLLEEHQQTDDQLTTANEELLSSNEELQSTNEELQSTQEELQSSNEELHTLNDELQSRNDELYQVNNDLINLITSVDIPIIIVGIDRRLRRFTPQARTIMDVTPADIGRPINQIRWNLSMPKLEQWLSEVLDTLTMKEEEVQDQNGHWYQIQVRAYKTLENKLDGAVISIADINVLKKLLRDSEAARDEAAKARTQSEAANRGKDVFLALLSHELRTPLSAMLIQAQLLRSGRLDQSKTQRATEVIERGVKVQTKLIDDLLDVSRIVAGKLRMERVEVDLTSVIQSAVDIVRASAEANSIRMKVELDRTGSRVLGDPTRLKQVIWNLLTNAIKYTPEGGWVWVSLERRGADARISVTDSGQGIRAEFLPHVFEAFSQADTSTTRVHGGLGLGLAIARNIVDFHGGTVRATSAGEGTGATFEITLPLPKAPSAQEQPASDLDPVQPVEVRSKEAESSDLNGIRVLLVDDDREECDTIAEALERYGAAVKVARSANEAMQAFAQFRPEVLLCDISMPGEDGYSLLARVRKLSADHGGQVPAAAVTAHAGKEDQDRTLSAGFQMHVPKPIDLATLAAVVVKLSGRTSQTAS
jgi:two-component system CheB/CheR fusion protein